MAFRIVLTGDAEAGKTQLMSRLIGARFSRRYCPTVGVAFGGFNQDTPDNNPSHAINLQFWDLAGQERFRTTCNIYLKDADIILLCCDLTSQNPFDNLPQHIKQCKELAKEAVIILVGTKLDKENQIITAEQLETLAKQHGCLSVCTSAKDDNLEPLRDMLTRQIIEIKCKKTPPNILHVPCIDEFNQLVDKLNTKCAALPPDLQNLDSSIMANLKLAISNQINELKELHNLKEQQKKGNDLLRLLTKVDEIIQCYKRFQQSKKTSSNASWEKEDKINQRRIEVVEKLVALKQSLVPLSQKIKRSVAIFIGGILGAIGGAVIFALLNAIVVSAIPGAVLGAAMGIGIAAHWTTKKSHQYNMKNPLYNHVHFFAKNMKQALSNNAHPAKEESHNTSGLYLHLKPY